MSNNTYTSGVVAVSTTAVKIATVALPGSLVVSNTGSASVFLGGSGVTSATGYPLAAGATLNVPAVGDDPHDLYAIAAASTSSTVAYLQAAG